MVLRSLIFLAVAATAQLLSTGASVSLDGIDYFIAPFSEGSVKPPSKRSSSSDFGFRPVTVISESILEADLHAVFKNWTSRDDVFTEAFSSIVYLNGKVPSLRRRADAQVLPLEDNSVPSGPYFLSPTGSLHRAYRLYRDFTGAFSQALLQKPDGVFQTLSAQVPGSASLTVGVPSRLYFTRSEDKPLAGARIGVKDIFSLAGTKTSNGNRAWYELYPPSTTTAPSIQRLIQAGAVIVGLQVASQFAQGEGATADWVDYHAPFNPRGDGYDQPASSTAGGGSSIAAYDWMDLAIGTDTGGSIRSPAGVQGLFGNRPSYGISNLEGIMPLSPTLDTIGLIARDPELWEIGNEVLFGEGYAVREEVDFPPKILKLNYPEAAETPSEKVLVEFAEKLVEFVNGNHSTLDLESAWEEGPPEEAQGTGIMEYLNLTYAAITGREQADLIRDPFYADYSAANSGRLPFINPVPLTRWTYGATIPSLVPFHAQKFAFQTWFTTHILPPSPITCSSALILRVISNAEPWWRNEYLPDDGGPPFGFNDFRISPFAGVPEFVFPVGQAGVESIVTGRVEMFPVSVGVMAARGCDGLLGRLAVGLVRKGVLRVPRTGREV